MKKHIVFLSSIMIISSIWGYIVGMLDFRLMVNTSALCTCWIKFGVLMAITTIILSIAAAFFIIKKTKLFPLEKKE